MKTFHYSNYTHQILHHEPRSHWEGLQTSEPVCIFIAKYIRSNIYLSTNFFLITLNIVQSLIVWKHNEVFLLWKCTTMWGWADRAHAVLVEIRTVKKWICVKHTNKSTNIFFLRSIWGSLHNHPNLYNVERHQ